MKKFISAVLVLLLACMPSIFVFADATWTPAADDWVTGANWLPATAPGSVSGTVLNPDTAVFSSTAGHNFTTVSVDNNRNVQNIAFDAAAEAYTLMFTSSIFTFLLTAGGVIQNNASTANSQNINLNTQLNGAYTFSSNSNVSGDIYTMNFGKGFVSDSITQAVTGALTLGGANTGNNTISTDLKDGAGTLSLIKNGAGTWVLSGTNTYTGLTDVQAGTLAYGASNVTADADHIKISGGTLDIKAFSDTVAGVQMTSGNINGTTGVLTSLTNFDMQAGSVSAILAGSVGLNKTGIGIVTLSGANTYTGGTNINGGVLQLNGAGTLGSTLAANTIAFNGGTLEITSGINSAFTTAQNIIVGSSGGTIQSDAITGTTLTDSGSVSIGSGNTLTVTGSGNTTLGGNLTGGSGGANGSLNKTGIGTLILSGTNSFNDISFNVTGGTLQLGSSGALGYVRYPSSVNSGGTLDLNGTIIPGTSFSELGIGGTGVGGNGALINSSASNAAWDGNSLYLIANARINCNGTGTLTIDTTNSPALNNPYLDLGTYGLTVGGVGDTFIYNIITSTNSSGTLTKDGTGTLQLLGANTYTGTTTIDAGTLILSGGAAIVDTGAVSLANVSGATLKLNASETIGSLSGGGTTGGNTNLQSFTLTTGDAGNATYGGVISGTGGLIKNGTGMLILNGNNAYAGATTINSGTLRITTATGLGTTAGGVSVANGATLDLNGTFAVGDEAVTLANGSTLSSSLGTNSISGAIGVTGTSTVDVATSLTLSGAVTGSVYPATIFAKTGTGTLVLSGNTDNFDLSAVVNAGTLSLEKTASNAVADLTLIAGTVRLNGTDDCQIWDSGAVTLNGGTLDMNAHNETIGSLGGSAGTITNGVAASTSILTVGGNGTTATFSGTIQNGSGIVGLTKAGGDTFTLSGTAANTYSGLTTVSDGELDLNKTAGINAIGGNLLISGTGTVKLLAADQIANTAAVNMTAGAFSLNGMNETVDTFSNGGGIFTTGAGHLTGLGATVTWAGGTNTVNNGGLVVDSHIVITGGTNTVEGGAAGGVLQLNSGGTGLEMTGATLILNSDAATAGKLLLQGDVTTYASAASSNISNGLAFTNSGTIDLGAGTRTFTVADGAAASDLIVGAVITNGAVTKAGPGVLDFNGVNTYTGATTVNAGTLRAGNNNAFGTGAGGVINHATIDIGANTLNVAGVYTQADHSTLKVTIDSPSTSGKILSGANAVVSALSTIDVTIAGGVTIPDKSTFTIIDGLGGTGVNIPGTIISGTSLFDFLGSVLNGDLILTAEYPTAPYATTIYASVTTNSNARAAGTVLDHIANPSGDMTMLLNALTGLNDAQIASALDTMVPAVDAGVRDNSTAALNNFVAASLDRAQSVLVLDATGKYTDKCILPGHDDKINGIWAKEYGSHLDQGARKGIQGYDAWNAGTAIGIDHLFGDTFTLGVSGGYAYGNVDSGANNARATVDSAQGAVYAGYQGRDVPYFIDAAGSFARNWYKAKRDIDVGTINRIADSKYDGLQYGAYLGGGYNFELEKNIEVTPLASIQWNHLGLAGYTENNAGAMDLRVNRQSYEMLQSGLGASVAYCAQYKWGDFTPELHAKWLYDFIGDSIAVTSVYAGGGGSFTANGAKSAANSANLGGKLFFDFKNDVSLIAQCDTQIKSKFFGVYGSITLRYKF